MRIESEASRFVDIIKAFRSRRYAATFIIMIIASLVVATAIPQRNRMSAAEAFRLRSHHPEFSEFIRSTGLDHLYTTWWFLSIVGLFSLNIGLNLAERIGISARQFSDRRTYEAAELKFFPLGANFSAPASADDFRESVEAAVSSAGYGIEKGDAGFVGNKGRIGYFWVPLFHGSIFLILIGVLISGLFKFSGDFEISEGQTFSGAPAEFINRWYGASGYRPAIDFSLRLKKYESEMWDETHPKLYRSTIEVSDKRGKGFTSVMEENRPLAYRGFTFYQTKYHGFSAFFVFRRAGENAEAGGYVNFPYRKNYTHGVLDQEFQVPGSGISARIELDTRRAGQMHLKLENGSGELYNGYLKEGQSIATGAGSLRLGGIQKWTGILVSRDPGVPAVYAGFLLLAVSAMGIAFVTPRRIWVAFESDGSAVLGARAARNRTDFEGEFKAVAERIRAIT